MPGSGTVVNTTRCSLQFQMKRQPSFSVGIAEENDKLLAVMGRLLVKRAGKSELASR